MARRTGKIGLETGMKLFVPLLVLFLFLGDIGVYYVFSRLQDLVVDGFDRNLLSASRMVRSRLDIESVAALAEKRGNGEYAKVVRKALMSIISEGRFLSAMVVNRDMNVLADSRALDSSGSLVPAWEGVPDLVSVWSGEHLFVTVKGEKGLWTRYVFVPLSTGEEVFAALVVGSDFSLQHRLLRVTDVYMSFRLIFLVFLVGAVLLFVISVLKPFERLKETALVVREESKGEEDSEFIVSTFQKVVGDLRAKEVELQRLLAEQKSRAENLEEYNEYILSSMSGGLVSIDSKGIITTFNRAAGEMLDLVSDEVLNKEYGAALRIPVLGDLIRDALEKNLARANVEITLPAMAGGDSYLSVSSTVLRGDDNEVIGAALLITDVTELKRLQEKILLREKLASLGEMSAGIAHQFKNSLGSIIGYATLLKKGASISTVDKILKESMMLNDVVESFLNFARPVKVQPFRVNVRSLVLEVLESLREEMAERKIRERVSFAQSQLSVTGDPVLLKQALSNVFRNSFDAMSQGGTIRVESTADDKRVSITIADTGRGIPEKDLSHIFTPFFSLTEGGVGLGLPIAHRIITSHQGTIEVESKVGKGTTVVVSLPLRGETDE